LALASVVDAIEDLVFVALDFLTNVR